MKRGFTLIEIMIVIVIIGLMAGGVMFSFGMTDKARLQSSAWMVLSASKYAYARAVSQGSTVRMVLDFEKRTIQLQETFGKVVLNKDDETGVGLNRKDSADEYMADGSVKEGEFKGRLKDIGPKIGENSASDDASGIRLTDSFLKSIAGYSGGEPGYKGPRFEVIEGSRGEARALKGDTGFYRIYSPHSPEPIDDKYAFVYFFPGGMTEHTFIQISDMAEEDASYKTIEIHPLTGIAKVHHELVDPGENLDDMQEAER